MSKRVIGATLSSCDHQKVAAGEGKVFWAETVSVSGKLGGPLAVGAVPCLSPAFVKMSVVVLPTLGERKGGKSVFHAMAWLQYLEDVSNIAQDPESSPWQGHQLGSRVATLLEVKWAAGTFRVFSKPET